MAIASDGILGVTLAPGQISTLALVGVPADLFARFVKNGLGQYFSMDCLCFRATSFPWPTSMGGISVDLRQFQNRDWTPVPILSVAQNGLLKVMIQVPYGLTPCCGGTRDFSDPNYRNQIRFSAEGVPGPSQDFNLKSDRIHVVNNCDPQLDRATPGLNPSTSSPCGYLVTHADGGYLGQRGGAKPGEILTLYAYGLGETSPHATAGTAAPNPPALAEVGLTFSFTANTLPSPAGPNSPTVINTKPEFAGLVPGYAGLYQVNFRVPIPPPDTPSCRANTPYPVALSNVTVTLSGADSFDGAGFCVQVPATGAQARPNGAVGQK